MAGEFVWLMFDVALGVIVAGLLVPFALTAVPASWRGNGLVIGIAIATIVVVSVLRRMATSRAPNKRRPENGAP